MNKTATAEAAAYQQQLSGIAAIAAATGKSYDQLAASTLKLARETGNLGQSVRVMESLSTSGLQANTSLEKLAKTWAELGAGARAWTPSPWARGC